MSNGINTLMGLKRQMELYLNGLKDWMKGDVKLSGDPPPPPNPSFDPVVVNRMPCHLKQL